MEAHEFQRHFCQGSPDRLAGQEEQGGPLRAPSLLYGIPDLTLFDEQMHSIYFFFTSDHCESGFNQSFFPHKTLLWPILLTGAQARQRCEAGRPCPTSTRSPAWPDPLPKSFISVGSLYIS